MKRKNLIYTIVISVAIFYLTGYSFATEAKKEEVTNPHKTVRVKLYELGPENLTCEPGTTVTWVNFAGAQVEILFSDKKIALAAGCPSNFFIGENGAYESVKMCAGCTASLCFQEKGKYGYIVKESRTFFPESTKKELRGVIWVK